MSGKIDAARWEKGYGVAWKYVSGEWSGLHKPPLRGVDASYDAGAAEALNDRDRLDRAIRMKCRSR